MKNEAHYNRVHEASKPFEPCIMKVWYRLILVLVWVLNVGVSCSKGLESLYKAKRQSLSLRPIPVAALPATQ